MKILLITSIYPEFRELEHTRICHTFVKDWERLGHEVLVIRVKSVFPRIYYWVSNIFKNLAMKYAGNHLLDVAKSPDYTFQFEDIIVASFSIFKFRPHYRFPKSSIDNAARKVNSYLKYKNFNPDIITGHFFNPQIELISILKDRYLPRSKTFVVIHEKPEALRKCYKVPELKTLLRNFDGIGFRSSSLKMQFESFYFEPRNSFLCYSGIPAWFFDGNNCIKRKDSNSFIFVGQLIPRKYPDVVLKTLHHKYGKNFRLYFIGKGLLESELKLYVSKHNLDNNVFFEKSVKRSELRNFYDISNVFVMISEEEAFGLVYLEAMSRGCITIASKNEGMDGIIVNGYNGYLCEAGDKKELAIILDNISVSSELELNLISEKAINTAEKYTDELMAKQYLNNFK